MIQFNYETSLDFENETLVKNWISKCIFEFGFKEGDINFVFCSDEYLLNINLEFLKHNTYTDIISFDYSIGKILGGDIFISIDRVKENAKEFDQKFGIELRRVIIHGVLHFMDFKDSTEKEKREMRKQEDICLEMLN